MKNFGFRIAVIASALFPMLYSLACQIPMKTIKTGYYEFSTGSGWSEDEKRIIEKIIANLDNIHKEVNEMLENELPPKLKVAIRDGGLGSTAVREEEKLLLNSVHIKNLNLRDCLDRIAHETAHIALFRMSKEKITEWENKFLDEGVALYIGYLYVGELNELNALSNKIAKEDFKSGKASLAYLRNWEKNVREKQRQFDKKWRNENPGKTPTLEDFIQGGYRTYFTSYSFVKAFMDKYGLSQLLRAIRDIGKGTSQSEAFKMVTGKTLDELISEWHASLI